VMVVALNSASLYRTTNRFGGGRVVVAAAAVAATAMVGPLSVVGSVIVAAFVAVIAPVMELTATVDVVSAASVVVTAVEILFFVVLRSVVVVGIPQTRSEVGLHVCYQLKFLRNTCALLAVVPVAMSTVIIGVPAAAPLPPSAAGRQRRAWRRAQNQTTCSGLHTLL
jgi:hypothetical protein